MAIVELSRGAIAIIDDQDAERVLRYKWSLDGNGYAVRKQRIATGQYRKVMLHRFILRAPAHMDIDHVDGNPLNCRRSNMRLATRSQNSHNRGAQVNGRSPYKGVHYKPGRSRPIAVITVGGRRHFLGSFDTEEQAARAYDRAALKLLGEFAYLNFPPETHVQNNMKIVSPA